MNEHEVVIRFDDVENAEFVSKRISKELGLKCFVRTNEERELLSKIADDTLEIRLMLDKYGLRLYRSLNKKIVISSTKDKEVKEWD